nr:MAG TPA: hypothetical protein [Caudoviricetes sp.]
MRQYFLTLFLCFFMYYNVKSLILLDSTLYFFINSL